MLTMPGDCRLLSLSPRLFLVIVVGRLRGRLQGDGAEGRKKRKKGRQIDAVRGAIVSKLGNMEQRRVGGERPDRQGSGGQIQQQLGSAQSRGRRQPSLARAQRVGTLVEWGGKSPILL